MPSLLAPADRRLLADLARQAGDQVSLETERGYHAVITAPRDQAALRGDVASVLRRHWDDWLDDLR